MKIYYADGSTFTGDVYEAPAFGVLLILEVDKYHGRRMITQGDYYVLDTFGFRNVDFVGLIDYLAMPGPKKVLIGRLVDNETWNATVKRANEDPDFPARTGYHSFEANV